MSDWLAGRFNSLPVSGNWWIAYSGGLDSHVLLLLAHKFSLTKSKPERLRAVHVHHGLMPQADAWVVHCQKICLELSVPLTVLHVDANPIGKESPEEAARRARYHAIAGLMSPGDTLVTAQHQDDQAETLLLQLLRGAGLAGLAAMPESASFGPGILVRPLLAVPRSALNQFALAQNLIWIEDTSNADLRYDRNYLRNEVLPALRRRWPATDETLARSARHCAQAENHLSGLSAKLYHTTALPDGSLSIQELLRHSAPDQRLILREWLKRRGLRMPSSRNLDRVINEILPAAADRHPTVAWPEGEIRRYRDRLMIFNSREMAEFDGSLRTPWRGGSFLCLPGHNGELRVELANGPGIDPEAWQNLPREIRYRQGGETCRIPGRNGSRCLKKLFQERGIPPWIRPRIPLIYIDDALAAVADYWVCDGFVAPIADKSIQIRWIAPPTLQRQ